MCDPTILSGKRQ